MNRFLDACWAAAALSVAALAISCTIVVWRVPALLTHADGVLIRAQGVESKINATAVNLDKATKIWSDSSSQQAAQISDAAQNMRLTLGAAQDAIAAIRVDAAHLQGTIDASTELLASAKETTDALPGTLGDARSAIARTLPAVDTGISTLADVDSLIRRPSIVQSLDNFAAITGSTEQVTRDFAFRFHDVLFPPPCRSFGCWVARRAWPALKSGIELGEAGYWTKALITDLKP